MTAGKGDAGLSLLELVAVMAIFSVLALMGVQLLSQAMLNRDTLARADARMSSLTAAIAVLRRDLEFALPQPDTAGDRPIFAIGEHELRLSVPSETGSMIIVWHVDPTEDRLVRETDAPPNAPLRLADVDAMKIDVFDRGGWNDGTAWRPRGPADLPRGIRVVLSLNDLGDIPVVVAR